MFSSKASYSFSRSSSCPLLLLLFILCFLRLRLLRRLRVWSSLFLYFILLLFLLFLLRLRLCIICFVYSFLSLRICLILVSFFYFLLLGCSVDLFSYPSSSPLARLSPHIAILLLFLLIIISPFYYTFLVRIRLVFIQPIFFFNYSSLSISSPSFSPCCIYYVLLQS